MPRNLPPGYRSGLNTFCLDAYQMCHQSSMFPPNEHLLTLATLPSMVVWGIEVPTESVGA